MDIAYVLSCAPVSFHQKIWKILVYTKKTNNVWIAQDTIYVCLLFFCTSHILSYFETKFFECSTYNITYVHELFHNFLILRSAAPNNELHPQLVAEYLLSIHMMYCFCFSKGETVCADKPMMQRLGQELLQHSMGNEQRFHTDVMWSQVLN
jgi:hypothetical protein